LLVYRHKGFQDYGRAKHWFHDLDGEPSQLPTTDRTGFLKTVASGKMFAPLVETSENRLKYGY